MEKEKRHGGPGIAGGAVLLLLSLLSGCDTKSTSEATGPKNFNFWPVFPNPPRIQYLVSYASSNDIEPAKGGLDKLLYGKEIEPSNSIEKPYGVAMNDGKIYVCDSRGQCLTVLDLRKHEMRLLGGSGPGRLNTPVAVTIAPDGMIYVADTGRGAVIAFSRSEGYVGTIGHPNMKPVNLAVHGDELYVCDYAAGRIEVMDRHTGKTNRYISSQGREEGQLGHPLGLAMDSAGNIYVTDVFAYRLQKFDPSGKFLASIGAQALGAKEAVPGDVPGTFSRPKHLAVDRDGIVYVVDAAFQNVQLWNAQGQALTDFGGPGTHLGNMDLPAGICVHEGDLDLFKQYLHPAFQADRLIIVTNQIGPNKVSVYALGHEKEGMSVGQFAHGPAASSQPAGLPGPASTTTTQPGETGPGR